MDNFCQISTELWPLIYVIKILSVYIVLNEICVAGYHACLQRFYFLFERLTINT